MSRTACVDEDVLNSTAHILLGPTVCLSMYDYIRESIKESVIIYCEGRS